MVSSSSTPFSPISDPAKTSFNLTSFSLLVPDKRIIGCILSIEHLLRYDLN